jgi:hypothetical protein
MTPKIFKRKMTGEVYFLSYFRIVDGGNQSTRHVGHYWPIVPAPGDCDDDGKFGGMEIGRGNRSTRIKTTPAPLCPPQIPLTRPGFEPGPPRWEVSD